LKVLFHGFPEPLQKWKSSEKHCDKSFRASHTLEIFRPLIYLAQSISHHKTIHARLPRDAVPELTQEATAPLRHSAAQLWIVLHGLLEQKFTNSTQTPPKAVLMIPADTTSAAQPQDDWTQCVPDHVLQKVRKLVEKHGMCRQTLVGNFLWRRYLDCDLQ